MRLSELAPSSFQRFLAEDGIAISIPPFRFGIRSGLATLAPVIQQAYGQHELSDPRLADFTIDVRLTRDAWRPWLPMVDILVDGMRPFESSPASQAFAVLEWAMNWCITEYAQQFVVAHAAVLARNGRALILPAPPGSGKSTLCAALTLAGWDLLSDELALINPESLQLTPFVRPVSLKNASIDVIRQRHPDASLTPPIADTVKGVVAHLCGVCHDPGKAVSPADPCWLVFPRYVKDSPTRFTPVPGAEAAAALIGNTFNYAVQGSTAFNAIARLADAAGCYTLRYSNLDDVIARLDALTRLPVKI